MGGIDVKSRPNRSGKQIARAAARSGLAGPTRGRSAELAALGQDVRRQLRGQRHEQRRDQRDRERATAEQPPPRRRAFPPTAR